MRWIIYFLVIGLFSCSTISANETDKGEPPKVGDDAPDFTLQDAEDKEHALKKLRGKVIFLILGNRKIRKEDDKWAEAFQKDYRGKDWIVAYIIADMRSVPGFVPQGFIKRQLKKNKPPITLLLDWKGKVHQAYHTQKEKPNLYLIEPKGKITFQIQSDFNPKTYQQVKREIDSIRAEAANE
jgi:predicted transcriptional regulator